MTMMRMTTNNTDMQRLRDLQQFVRQVEHREDLIAFSGPSTINVPGMLLFDSCLNSDDKIYWCQLRMASLGNHIQQMPDQSTLADIMNKSRPVIIACNKILRATRWLTILDTVHKNNLPTRYSYAINERPLTLEETMELDPDYMAFIINSAESKTERLAQYGRNLIIRSHYFRNTSTNHITKNLQDKERSVVKNFDSEKTPAVKNFDNEETGDDIYKTTCASTHTRACAPTQSRIKTKGFNNNTSIQGWGSGGRDENPRFAFLCDEPLNKLVKQLDKKYGKKSAHHILNRLKLGEYTYQQDKSFRYQIDADDASIILTSLIDRDVNSPLQFVDTLIYRASKGELVWRGGQLKHYREITGQSNATNQESIVKDKEYQEKLDNLQISDGTILIGCASGNKYILQDQFITGADYPNYHHDYLSLGVNDMNKIKGLVISGHLRLSDEGEKS
ncbi:MAG: hypothetical protein Q4A74_08195 [Cardiobacteriaceae bacterium]|nr:hypothetical protein [Cardiobacteriaceae bacterium]